MAKPHYMRGRQDGLSDRLPGDVARPLRRFSAGTITGVVVGAGLLGLCLLGLGYAIVAL